MSVRTKFHLLSFVAFPIGGLALGVLGMMVHGVFGLLALCYTIVIGILGHSIRCPKCHTRLIWQGCLLFPYIGRRCRSCGYDLTGREEEGKE